MGEWSDDLLQMLDGQLSALLQLDLAQSTRKAYDVHVRQYLEMCVRLRKPGVPTAATLARFVLGRAVSGYKLSGYGYVVPLPSRMQCGCTCTAAAQSSCLQRPPASLLSR